MKDFTGITTPTPSTDDPGPDRPGPWADHEAGGAAGQQQRLPALRHPGAACVELGDLVFRLGRVQRHPAPARCPIWPSRGRTRARSSCPWATIMPSPPLGTPPPPTPTWWPTPWPAADYMHQRRGPHLHLQPTVAGGAAAGHDGGPGLLRPDQLQRPDGGAWLHPGHDQPGLHHRAT